MESNDYSNIVETSRLHPEDTTMLRIFRLKYFLIVAIICLLPYITLSKLIPAYYLYIGFIVESVLFLVLAITHIIKLRKSKVNVLSENDKIAIVAITALNPFVSIPAYYFSLRKRITPIAISTVKIGLVVLAQYILYIILFIALSVTLTVQPLQPSTWTQQEATNFKSYITVIENDVNNIFTNSRAQDVAKTRVACVQLGVDVNKGNQLPAFPGQSIQTQLTSGLTDLNNASTDCIKGIDSGDTAAASKSTNEILSGYKSINSAITAMKQ